MIYNWPRNKSTHHSDHSWVVRKFIILTYFLILSKNLMYGWNINNQFWKIIKRLQMLIVEFINKNKESLVWYTISHYSEYSGEKRRVHFSSVSFNDFILLSSQTETTDTDGAWNFFMLQYSQNKKRNTLSHTALCKNNVVWKRKATKLYWRCTKKKLLSFQRVFCSAENS